MLDEKDLQAIAQIMDSKIRESEQRTAQLIDSRLMESEQRTAQAIRESEQRTMQVLDSKLKESEQRTMQGAATLMESYFEPKFKLLAEGIQSLKETQIPKDQFDELREEVFMLRAVVRRHSEEIKELKHA